MLLQREAGLRALRQPLLFVLQGMGYLHAKGIVHKDLKSKNVFHDTNKVVITDFGLFGISGVVQEGRWGSGWWGGVGWVRGLSAAGAQPAALPRAPRSGATTEVHCGSRLQAPCLPRSVAALLKTPLTCRQKEVRLRTWWWISSPRCVSFPGGRTSWSCRTAGSATWRQRSCAGWAPATTRTTFRSPPRPTFTPLGRPRPLPHFQHHGQTVAAWVQMISLGWSRSRSVSVIWPVWHGGGANRSGWSL